MDSEPNKTGLEDKAWIAFKECSSALEKKNLAVELRPRFRDAETAFSGDYDYLMDASRFDEIVRLFFQVCVDHAVSFQVKQRAVFKRQIVLMGRDARTIVFEFWPHAELTTGDHQGWSYLSYRRFSEACEAGCREETLALLFIGHLYFKKKDLTDSQNQWRLEEFARLMTAIVEGGGERASYADKIREMLSAIIEKKLSLAEANQMTIRLLSENNIGLEDSSAASRRRWFMKVRRLFSGWGGKIVPCVGPDGSGKTHFIAAVMNMVEEHSLKCTTFRFKKLFRKNKIYAFINKRYRRRHDVPKNIADERLAHILYWAALPCYLWEIVKNMCKQAVFMDRFFLEFMVRGYRESNSEGVTEIRRYSFLSRWIPEPRRLVVLTADDALISSRKAELSPEAIRDFYDRYISYATNQRVSNVLYLNTHLSGEELAERCLNSFGLLEKTSRQ